MENNDIRIQFVPIELCEFNEGQIEGVPSNPRTREDAKQKNLEKSIEELPEMTVARAALCFPHNGKYVVIGGNRRLEAQRALGRAEIPIITLPADTPVEKLRRIALLDNESTGQNDWAKLAKEWSLDELSGWGIELPKKWGGAKSEVKEKPEVPFAEVLNEEHNYIVLYFDNTVDWLQACTLLDLPRVRTYNTSRKGENKNTTRYGIGRVVKGAKAIEQIIKSVKDENIG
jgi:hypothetical protein